MPIISLIKRWQTYLLASLVPVGLWQYRLSYHGLLLLLLLLLLLGLLLLITVLECFV